MDETTETELDKVENEDSKTPFLMVVVQVRSSCLGNGAKGEGDTSYDDRAG